MRPVANREAAYRVTAAEPALQFQCFGGEGAGGLYGAGVFGAQGVEAGGGQGLLLATDSI